MVVLLVILTFSLNELYQTELNRVMSQPGELTQTALSSEREVNKSTWTCCSSHYLHPSTTSCHLLFCPSFQFRLSASTLSLLPSHSPQFLYFSRSSASASAVPRGYETVLETRCMCHGLSSGDEDPLMVRGLFILFAGLYNTVTQQQKHIHTVCM